MSLKPFPGFKSFETHHCVTGSMLHIFRFNDIPANEEMLLGLGSGIGFIYWNQKGIDPFIGGRANVGRAGEEGLEVIASRRLGIKTGSYYTGSARKAEKTLLELLGAGQPVMIQVDMGYLPYFDFGGEEYHFGYHVIVAAGHNPVTHQLLIADRDLALHPISWDDLVKARGSLYKPFPPKKHWYTYDFTKYHPPKSDDVLLSIREVTTGMLEPAISNLGVKGIRKTAKCINDWPDKLGSMGLRRTFFNTYIFIDATGGTGGGIFRYMYGRYLQEEAAEITGVVELSNIGDTFKVIGDHWQEIAEMFKVGSNLDDPAELLPEINVSLLAIADMEQGVWERLMVLVGNG